MLCAVHATIIRLSRDHPDHASILDLSAHYHNLVREWADE